MVRGVARCEIFRDEFDRARFVDHVRRVVSEEGVKVYAWALMPNHVHLIARSGEAGVSRLMARVCTSHARAFNTRHDRVGHLFQNRFRSVLVESDSHLRWLLRYVHRNPVEAGIVGSARELEAYPWAGHRELVSDPPAPLVDIEAVLGWFAPDRPTAIGALNAWMADDSDDPPAEAISEPASRERLIQSAIDRVAAAMGVDPADISSGARSRDVSAARAAVVAALHRELGLPLAEIERRLGLSAGAAHRALRRARRLVRN
jgi:REP element-mobilizing transposase RayT